MAFKLSIIQMAFVFSMVIMIVSTTLPVDGSSMYSQRSMSSSFQSSLENFERSATDLALTFMRARSLDWGQHFKSALMAPYNILTQIIKDLLSYWDTNSFYQFTTLSGLKDVVYSLPGNAYEYWDMLFQTEVDCIYRSVCDVTSFVAPRSPEWFKHMAGLYFHTYSSDNFYFRALATGIINRNCSQHYPLCSPALMFNTTAFQDVFNNKQKDSDIIASNATLHKMNAKN